DQYSAFIDLVQNMNKEEYRMYPNSLAYLNSMFDVTENSYGRGFFKIFNSCILSENINYDGQVRIGGDIYNHINILIALVDNDEELFSSIFSGDINNVIECIIKNTGYKDRKAIEELILKIDLYTDLVLYNYYMDEKIRTSYEDRINEIIRLIIEAKRENYPDFGNTLYMKVLRDSIFYDKDKYMIYPGITTNTFRLKINDGKETYYTPYIDSSYLYGEDSIEKFKAIGVNNILSRSFNLEKEEYYTVENTMQLLMSLLDSNIEFTNVENSDELRKKIYSNLSSYFSNEEEFNTFVLKLYSSNEEAFSRYFEIFIQSIEKNGITYDDFLRYQALVNYNNRRKHVSIDYQDQYIDSEELEKMTEEEYKDLASSREDIYFISSIDYKSYFEKIDEILAQNDLGFEILYDKDSKIEWVYGTREIIGTNNPQAISSEVLPEMMEYNGTYIIFYEFPKYYEEGLAVNVFTNIYNQTMTREIEGFKAEIIDPQTGKPRTIYVVGMGTAKDGYKSIRFMVDIATLNKNKENNQAMTPVLSGGSYE
nr:hypothetical protein [Bacilli bacterium]